jgi:hypothetical protein
MSGSATFVALNRKVVVVMDMVADVSVVVELGACSPLHMYCLELSAAPGCPLPKKSTVPNWSAQAKSAGTTNVTVYSTLIVKFKKEVAL